MSSLEQSFVTLTALFTFLTILKHFLHHIGEHLNYSAPERVLCYKIFSYFNSSFRPFVFYLREGRISATVTDSLHLMSFVLVGISTSPLTSSLMGVTQSRSRPAAPFDPTASL